LASTFSLPYVIAEKIYVVLPHNLRVFIDGKARRIRYTRPSNQNHAICLPGGTGTTPKNGESCGDAYVNFMMEEGEERVKASYRDNYDRLAAVKSKYNTTNIFRVNQNIKPAI
jgi:Berberine and berberine like